MRAAERARSESTVLNSGYAVSKEHSITSEMGDLKLPNVSPTMFWDLGDVPSDCCELLEFAVFWSSLQVSVWLITRTWWSCLWTGIYSSLWQFSGLSCDSVTWQVHSWQKGFCVALKKGVIVSEQKWNLFRRGFVYEHSQHNLQKWKRCLEDGWWELLFVVTHCADTWCCILFSHASPINDVNT